MLETLDYTIRTGCTPTFLYFDLFLKMAAKLYFCIYIIRRTSSNVLLRKTRDEILQLHLAIGFANLSRANLHAPLGNRCSDMFAFPQFLRKLSKLAK